MNWSTRQLAELANTTVNTVRHYHRLGLLEEPDRGTNGYKRYGVRHLVRLLRIRRLTALGVALSDIGEVEVGGEQSERALRELDADLVVSIERLERTRREIAAILADQSPVDVPPGFESVAARLSQADRSLLLIYAEMYDAEAMADLHQLVSTDADTDIEAEFDRLPPDADDDVRARLAAAMAPDIANALAEHAWLREPETRASRPPSLTRETFVEAVVELYNPAQLDVLRRASAIATGQSTPPVVGPTAIADPTPGPAGT